MFSFRVWAVIGTLAAMLATAAESSTSTVAAKTATAAPVDEACAAIIPHAGQRAGKDVTDADLLSIRDFGAASSALSAPAGFALSPDGLRLAVQVRQAVPSVNRYCQAIMVFDLGGKRPTSVIELGGDYAHEASTVYGMRDFPSGTPRPFTPAWSPNGAHLAFLKSDSGTVRLYVSWGGAKKAIPVTDKGANVLAFRWSHDGTQILYERDEALKQAQAEQKRQGLSGYLYDGRFWMLATTEPFVRGEFRPTQYRVAVSSSGKLSATGRCRQDATLECDAAAGPDNVSVETDAEPRFAYRTRLRVAVAGQKKACLAAACEDPVAAWMLPRNGIVIYFRREGFAREDIALYRWDTANATPQRIGVTKDLLVGCQLLLERLFCGRERSLSPRDIVEVDLRTGELRQLLNLNPEWDALRKVEVRRLRWTNSFGLDAIGDLVVPPTPPGKNGYPLVVVQYDTRGFLRGGTGDEYPILAMANQGFAVLSISRPIDINISQARAGQNVDQQKLMREWTDRKSVHSSLLEGLTTAERVLTIDQSKIAITGLSDGASTATYALIHSDIFSFALLSTCCEDPETTTTAIGPAYEKMQRDYLYPLPWEDYLESWREMSLAMNAKKICADVLVQAADREARMALSSYKALKQVGVNIKMYIYPDEYHIKWQPAHRAAIYKRSLTELREWRDRPPGICN